MLSEYLPAGCDALPAVLPIQRWKALATLVRSYRADVVVLVARKMPRLAEFLQLDFGPAEVISDLAIPYAAEGLRSKRVAIVDDIVNVGSTLQAAFRKACAVGARDVQLFALAQREGPKSLEKALLSCADGKVYSHPEMREFAREVPEILRLTCKPYDLEFPIIPCRLATPYSEAGEILSFLYGEFGRNSVHDVSHAPAKEQGRFRYTVVLQGNTGSHRKIRLYINERDGLCMLVPFVIPMDPEDLTKGIAASPALTDVWNRASAFLGAPSAEIDTVKGESVYRLQLYLTSWVTGLSLLQQRLARVLQLDNGDALSYPDAQLLFGRSVCRVLEEADIGAILQTSDACFQATSDSQKPKRHSVFAAKCPEVYSSEFVLRVRHVARSSGLHDLFLEFFAQLAVLTGAENPTDYQLSWPYDKETVARDPYLRLRIGPSFEDICTFFEMASRLLPGSDIATPEELSALLDWAIDEGTVVPAIAAYDGVCYRVYRKGESKSRDKAVDRLAYALKTLPNGLEVSRTRTAKILATLSFSHRIPRTTFPGALSRGTVGVFPGNSIDQDETEITQYARNIGRIKFIE